MNDLDKYEYFLIVDLEATCCDKKSIKRHEMEIIEIGAVMVEASTLTVLSEFQTFVKPIRFPLLTDFCKSLTSIEQSQVDSAASFAVAVSSFKVWLHQYDSFVFCSWGDYDKSQIEQDCKFHGVPYPIASEHLNIKKLFTASQGLKKKFGMAEALKLAGLSLDGIHHRGIDDARNMARLMPYILGRRMI